MDKIDRYILLVGACDRARLNPQIIFESGQFSSLLSLVGTGMGVSIVPEMAAKENSGCRYIRLADEEAKRTIGAAVLRGRSLSRAHKGFLALILQGRGRDKQPVG